MSRQAHSHNQSKAQNTMIPSQDQQEWSEEHTRGKEREGEGERARIHRQASRHEPQSVNATLYARNIAPNTQI